MASAHQSNIFSIGEAVSHGWELTKENYGTLVKIAVIYLAIQLGWSVISGTLGSGSQDSAAMGLVMMLLGLMVSIGLTFVAMNGLRVLIRLVVQPGFELEELFVVNWRMLLSYIGYQILVFLLVGLPMLMVGLLLVVSIVGPVLASFILQIDPDTLQWVAGLGVLGGVVFLLVSVVVTYVSIGLSQGRYLIVDQQLGPIAAAKKSWQITARVKLRLFGLGLVLGLLNLLGVLLLLVGLLVTIPTSIMAVVWVYTRLRGDVSDEDGQAIEAVANQSTPAKSMTAEKKVTSSKKSKASKKTKPTAKKSTSSTKKKTS